MFKVHQHQTLKLTTVGAVGELELLGQECSESLLGMSQMEGGTAAISGQLDGGSDDFGRFIPLTTKFNRYTYFSFMPVNNQLLNQLLYIILFAWKKPQSSYLLSG